MNLRQKLIIVLLSIAILSVTSLAATNNQAPTTPTAASAYYKISHYGVSYSNDRVTIWLTNEKYTTFALLDFLPDGRALPPASTTNGVTYMYYHHADFENILDILRASKTPEFISSNQNSYIDSGYNNPGV